MIQLRDRTFAAAVLLGLLSPGVVHAETAKPAIELTSAAVEVTVTLDEGIRANTPLADHLLADSKSWAKRQYDGANKEQKASPDLFANGRSWFYQRQYTLDSRVADRYSSVVLIASEFTGGAHPNHGYQTYLWDGDQKKMISIRPFFKELKDNGPTLIAIRKLIVADLVAEKKKRDSYDAGQLDWQKSVEPRLLGIGAVTLTPSTEAGKSAGLTFYYSPYDVGPYAEGSYTAFVPWAKLTPYLTAAGQAIFGGDKLMTDKDKAD